LRDADAYVYAAAITPLRVVHFYALFLDFRLAALFDSPRLADFD